MKTDGIIWLILPLIGILTAAVVAKGSPSLKPNKKALASAIVLAAIIYGSYIIFRSLFLGGF